MLYERRANHHIKIEYLNLNSVLYDMKNHNCNIKQLIEKSEHLNDLERLLAENGIEFESKKKLKKFLYESWIKSNEDLISELQISPLENLEDLPYTEVQRNGIVYRVHGIIHGQAPFGDKLKKGVKEFISDKVKMCENPPHEDYVLERGFANALGLNKSKEMDYFERVYRRMGMKKMIGKFLKMIFKIPIISIRKYFYKIFGSQTIRMIYKSLDDIRYLPKVRKVYRLTEQLPMPLDSELRLATGEELFVYFSEEMARFMLNYSRRNNLRILHGIVGLGHESSVSYYLRNL